MFKFLLYLFLFYFIFRFVFGALFKALIRSKMSATNGPHQQGSVKVDSTHDRSSAGKNNVLGEYVDYEEIK